MSEKRQRGSKHDMPQSAHIVRDYDTMKKIAKAFAAAQVKLLILLGAPGKGKGQILELILGHEDDFWLLFPTSSVLVAIII